MSPGTTHKKKGGKRRSHQHHPSRKLDFLCDINVPRELCERVNQISGYRALRMQELGLDEGSDSGSIKASAVQRKALILTFDGDFLDQNTFKICTHPGVLRLSMNSQATSYILPHLTQFLWSTDYKRCRHSIVELRDQVAIVRSKQGLQRPIRYWY